MTESIFSERPTVNNDYCYYCCFCCYSCSVGKSCSTLFDPMDCNSQATHLKGWIPQTHPTAYPRSQTRHLLLYLSVWSPIGPMVLHKGCGLDDWGVHWSSCHHGHQDSFLCQEHLIHYFAFQQSLPDGHQLPGQPEHPLSGQSCQSQ